MEVIAEPICRAHGLELVQVVRATEHGGSVLRVVIDRPGSEQGPGHGVSLGDCQAVSRDLGAALDVHDPVTGKYRLEVSSPGLDRPLVRPSDYERFKGRRVKVQLARPLDDGRGGERRRLTGTLLGLEGERARFEVDGTTLEVALGDIAKAHVVYEMQ